MKTTKRSSKPAFTLIEILLVITIIAILAALLLPVLVRGIRQAKIKRAQVEAQNIADAIHDYETAYGKFPVSVNALNGAQAVAGGPEDFTYGGTFNTPSGGTITVAVPGVTYTTNNAEIMAMLLDLESYPNGVPTINQGHVKNPQRTKFLNARLVSNTDQPGVGPDGVYRDPWGKPYVITIDLSYDDKARDAFYRDPNVSGDLNDPATPKRGLNGLIPKVTTGGTVYEGNSAVMVWSAGPDKMIEIGPANQGANKDNIFSWK